MSRRPNIIEEFLLKKAELDKTLNLENIKGFLTLPPFLLGIQGFNELPVNTL
jgi:hypothetical protein